MYSAGDYILFIVAVIAAYGFFGALGAFIEWREKRQRVREFIEENRHKFQLPKRRGVNYVQEWDEVLKGLEKRM